MKSFNEMGLCNELLQAITEQGYEHPMPVQEQVIPYLLRMSSEVYGNGKAEANIEEEQETGDLIALAQTGTGKTAAFLISVLNEKLTRASLAERKVLIMVPTRELAVQVQEECENRAIKINNENRLSMSFFTDF